VKLETTYTTLREPKILPSPASPLLSTHKELDKSLDEERASQREQARILLFPKRNCLAKHFSK